MSQREHSDNPKVKQTWEFPRKLSINLPYNQEIPLLVVSLQKNERVCTHKYVYVKVHGNNIYNSPKLKTTQKFTMRSMGK